MNTPQNPLTEQLSREADQFVQRGGRELELAQVLTRAGEIRRGRRMRATMLMAACVLAIAVPTTLVAVDRDRSHEPLPTRPSQTDTSPLTLGDLKVGDTPQDGYSQDGTWQLPVAANGLSGLRGRVVAAAAMKGGVMVAMATDQGDRTAYFIHAQGGVAEQSWPMEGDFAVADSGSGAAFVEPDGTPVVVQDEGTTTRELTRIPHGSGFTGVALSGLCSGRAEATGCAVWVQSNGEHQQTWVSTANRVETARPEFREVADVRDGDLVAGTTKVTDDGTCSGVTRFDQTQPDWTTCQHRLLAFSSDGTRVLATNAYGDGLGDTDLAVLDAASGKTLLDLRTTDGSFVHQMVWEDDSHVLATVYEAGRWAVLRVGLDGSREYAVEPVDGADSDSPFVLPTE